MGSSKEVKKVYFFKDNSKSEDEVHLSDMHDDGVHFNKEILAKAKRKKQIDKEKAEKKQRKKNRKKDL
ncbi:hypothetical protein [Psychroflexus aestuariivivens]|uniref:hypothetical protein n=1 Tax=Psychroflexus aestuariivivens TaxID=1795040 RepID=UPI000FDAEB4A|nr:hypothetical protein [Psychroflexus aestuariivivens]